MSEKKLNKAHVHIKIHFVFVNMSDENDVKIAAAACVILCVKKPPPKKKRRFWIRPSLKAKQFFLNYFFSIR